MGVGQGKSSETQFLKINLKYKKKPPDQKRDSNAAFPKIKGTLTRAERHETSQVHFDFFF